MQVAEPVAASWKASLSLGFEKAERKTVLARKQSDGPLVVQKALYPEGEAICHAIVVHPPGGIAGGDELGLFVGSGKDSCALLTTPGAAKWYRSAGPWAQQKLQFDVAGTLEWLPREAIVFDGALARLETSIELGSEARFIGWEVVCLGRRGAGERFERGRISIDTRIRQGDRMLFVEKGEIEGGGRLMHSPAGLAGCSVFATLLASSVPTDVVRQCRQVLPAVTLVPGLLVARYLGDSTEQAMRCLVALWKILRPAIVGQPAREPRIWST